MHIQFIHVQQCIQISTRINSSSVHTYIFVCFIRNSLRVLLQGFVTQNATLSTNKYQLSYTVLVYIFCKSYLSELVCGNLCYNDSNAIQRCFQLVSKERKIESSYIVLNLKNHRERESFCFCTKLYVFRIFNSIWDFLREM